jgi:hypothetical protein
MPATSAGVDVPANGSRTLWVSALLCCSAWHAPQLFMTNDDVVVDVHEPVICCHPCIDGGGCAHVSCLQEMGNVYVDSARSLSFFADKWKDG